MMQLTPSQYEKRYADLETLYHQIARDRQTRALENAELRQWMSDACDLLHDLAEEWHVPWRDRVGYDHNVVLDLLRRAENP